MSNENQYDNIPDEMKKHKAFVCWRYEELEEGKPTKVPYSPLNGAHASVNDPTTWTSFDNALSVVNYYSGIGFVLSDNDPYTFIDLDEPKDHLTLEEKQVIMDRQVKVFNEFNSYSEISPSGKGLHIIVKGQVKAGRKRSSIELYSNLRYMTMTGNVYKQSPIEDRQVLLTVLWEQMSNGGASALAYSGDDNQRNTDETIINMATDAKNGELFALLKEGRWREKYSSQSEADYAYIDILAFYTQNREQIARLFRNSALGQRPKALRVDYTNYMINKSFDRMLPPVDVEGLANMVEVALAEAKTKKESKVKKPKDIQAPNLTCSGTPEIETYLGMSLNLSQSPYTVPQGLVGAIAQFIYQSAPRQVPEIALAGAIGLMAGICGRSYNISATGLNQYVLLLAPTGSGKEAINSGINKLMAVVQKTVPAAIDFIGPAEIASSQALVKYMCNSISFVSIIGEIGLLFKQITAHNANSNQLGLRKILLDLFNKSGDGNVLRPTIYSDRDKNTAPLLSPAFSLLGETTPETFYESLSEQLISDGLLPRFTIIEYTGLRPPLNESHNLAFPSAQLIEQLSALCAYSLTTIQSNKTISVELSLEAKAIFHKFNLLCDKQINESEREVIKHLWNRAHIKSLKLAGLIAVGVAPYNPIVSEEVAIYSVKIIVEDVTRMYKMFETGDVGDKTGEIKQINKVKKAMCEYVINDYSKLNKTSKLCNSIEMHSNKVISYSYLSKKFLKDATFYHDKSNATQGLKRTLGTMIDNGDIEELKHSDKIQYKTSARLFMIRNPEMLKTYLSSS